MRFTGAQMSPAFLSVTKAPFLLIVLRARQLSLMRMYLPSSGTQMRLTCKFGETVRRTRLVM